MAQLSQRVIEAYVGEYASGKSEVSVNRALSLLGNEKVTLVDLDLVEPFYTLRPIKKQLEQLGLQVVAWETSETLGLGEAGSVIKPEMRWVLRRDGHIILDIGYGVDGVRILNLIEGASESDELKIFVVINISRPMTSTVDDIVEYVGDIGKIEGIINNSHLGDDTTVDIIQEGARIVSEAAGRLNLPVIASYIEDRFIGKFNDGMDCMGNPIRILKRYMQNTYW